MGCVQEAVLEFDGAVQAPWRPRLVADPVEPETPALRTVNPHPSRRSPSRVGVCRPPAAPARPAGPARRDPVRRAVPDLVARPDRGSAGRPRAARRAPAGPSAAVRVRLTRRARRLVVVLALAGAVALGSWLGPLVSGDEGGLRLAGVTSVVVHEGDTLWSIATSLGGDGDVRAVIDEIQRLNGLEGADLVPGQVLQLP